MRKQKTIKKLILFLIWILGLNLAIAQTFTCSGVSHPTTSTSSTLASCTATSSTFVNKLGTLKHLIQLQLIL